MKTNCKQSLLTGSLTLQNLNMQWTMSLLAGMLVCKPKENTSGSFYNMERRNKQYCTLNHTDTNSWKIWIAASTVLPIMPTVQVK
jgi:hypothetical protein